MFRKYLFLPQGPGEVLVDPEGRITTSVIINYKPCLVTKTSYNLHFSEYLLFCRNLSTYCLDPLRVHIILGR